MIRTGEPIAALGLMSGTSMDGIDAALIRTDGEEVFEFGPSLSAPYDDVFRGQIDGILGSTRPTDQISAVERELTLRHASAVRQLLDEAGPDWADTRLVGFHGQTIAHAPQRRFTWQLGDGALLSKETSLPVVYDLRSADVEAGGEGAPLAPVYHHALARNLTFPLAILNIGGVSNITILFDRADPIAFDTGPGNCLLDDWMLRHTGISMDQDGKLAASGTVDTAVLEDLMDHPYFAAPWPKSLDRRDFSLDACANLSPPTGAATLVAFTAEAIAQGIALADAVPARVLVTGGGRRNPVIMSALRQRLPCPVDPVEAVGWNGDMLEAQAFAFMAVRSTRGLPISFPGTTGVKQAMTGGRVAA